MSFLKNKKFLIIIAIVLVLLLSTITVVLGFISANKYREDVDERFADINTNLLCFNEEIESNLFVVDPAPKAYDRAQSCLTAFVDNVEELELMDKEFVYLASRFTEEKSEVEDVLDILNKSKSQNYVVFTEYFQEVLEYDTELARLNNNFPSNTEDFIDRIEKFKNHRDSCSDLLKSYESIEVDYELSKESVTLAKPLLENMIVQFDVAIENMENLRELQQHLLGLYPPLPNNHVNPLYTKNYSEMSKADLSSLSSAYNNMKNSIYTYNDDRASKAFNSYTILSTFVKDVNAKLSSYGNSIDLYKSKDLHVGEFKYESYSDSETQSENIIINLKVDEDGSLTLDYASAMDQDKYDFDTSNDFSTTGSIDLETLVLNITVEVERAVTNTLREGLAFTRTTKDSIPIEIKYSNGRYIVTVGTIRYDLRRV